MRGLLGKLKGSLNLRQVVTGKKFGIIDLLGDEKLGVMSNKMLASTSFRI